MDLTQFLQKTGSLAAPKSTFSFSLVEGGLPQGGLIEVSGAAGGGRIEAVLRFLAENPELQAAWVEEGATMYPCALPQHGVALERVLFVNAEPAHLLPGMERKSPLLDCAHQILKSGMFGALILIPRDRVHAEFIPTTTLSVGRPYPYGVGAGAGVPRIFSKENLGEIELRRLQIAAEKSGTTVFIVREKPSVACTWPLSAQLGVSRARNGAESEPKSEKELRVQILKRKYSFSQSEEDLKHA